MTTYKSEYYTRLERSLISTNIPVSENTMNIYLNIYIFKLKNLLYPFLQNDTHKINETQRLIVRETYLPMTKTTSTDICTSYPDHIPLALIIYLGG